MTKLYLTFKEWLIKEDEDRERIFKTEDEWYDFQEYLNEIKSEIELDIYHEMLNFKPGDTITWKVINANRAKKIWADYGKLGFIRDEKGINQIKDILIHNTIKLHLTNAICGHDRFYPQDEWEYSHDMTPEQRKKIDEVVEDYHFFTYNGQDLISDYGLPQLEKYLPELYKTQDSEEILRIADKMLNIVHQRNDLAGFFIQGGTSTLNQMSGEGLS